MIGKTRTSEPEDFPMVSDESTRRKVDRFSAKPQEPPLFEVVVFDDDFHTCRDYLETFQEIFGHSQSQAYQLTQDLAHAGRVVVWKGSQVDGMQKADRARNYQPRWRRGNSPTAPRWVEHNVPPLTIRVVAASSSSNRIDSKETNSSEVV